MILLSRVKDLLRENGYVVSNIDSTIVAQAPKMMMHIENMRENIASVLEIPVSSVNVKATTEEKLGFTGRKEGISAHAVCLISSLNENA